MMVEALPLKYTIFLRRLGCNGNIAPKAAMEPVGSSWYTLERRDLPSRYNVTERKACPMVSPMIMKSPLGVSMSRGLKTASKREVMPPTKARSAETDPRVDKREMLIVGVVYF